MPGSVLSPMVGGCCSMQHTRWYVVPWSLPAFPPAPPPQHPRQHFFSLSFLFFSISLTFRSFPSGLGKFWRLPKSQSDSTPHTWQNLPKFTSFSITMSDTIQKGFAVERSNSSQEDDGFQLRGRTELIGTEADENDMQMLGRLQQLNVFDRHHYYVAKLIFFKRNFRFISTLGFACTLMSTWEIALM